MRANSVHVSGGRLGLEDSANGAVFVCVHEAVVQAQMRLMISIVTPKSPSEFPAAVVQSVDLHSLSLCLCRYKRKGVFVFGVFFTENTQLDSSSLPLISCHLFVA